MKKKIVLAAVAILPLLTACGPSVNLKCSTQLEEVKRELIIEYDNDKQKPTGAVKKDIYELKDMKDLSKFNCETIEECLDKIAERVNDCESDEVFDNCKIINRTETGLTIEGHLTKDGVVKELKEKSYDDLKRILEERNNYTCE